jgi:hypothetical protein
MRIRIQINAFQQKNLTNIFPEVTEFRESTWNYLGSVLRLSRRLMFWGEDRRSQIW